MSEIPDSRIEAGANVVLVVSILVAIATFFICIGTHVGFCIAVGAAIFAFLIAGFCMILVGVAL